jgi:hypothetical protein
MSRLQKFQDLKIKIQNELGYYWSIGMDFETSWTTVIKLFKNRIYRLKKLNIWNECEVYLEEHKIFCE